MCCKLNKMKRMFILRFNRKPVTKRISCILCWSIGLIATALLLSGQFLCAFAFVTLMALAYLAIVLACKKIEEQNIHSMVNNCTYAAHRTVDIMLSRILDMTESKEGKEIRESNDKCQSAIMTTSHSVAEMQNAITEMNLRIGDLNNMLQNHVLPELGIYFSDTDDDWVRCDSLAKEIPEGVISLKISHRLIDNGIKTFADLVRCSENEILALPDLGNSSLERIKQLLDVMGLRLQMIVKEEDGAWYYWREEDNADSVATSFEEDSDSAESELLTERNNEVRV